MTKILREGMREGDLADLVLPLISVDEYVSKVDPSECVVFGFYVHDEDAAKDLNRFLQKSAISIMDTEISPAPDQHGFFMIFIELLNHDRLAKNISDVLSEIKSLVDIEEWEMQIRTIDDLIPFSENNLRDCLKQIKKSDKNDEIIEFLKPSILTGARIDEDVLILECAGEKHVYRIKQFSRIENILKTQGLTETPISYNIRTVSKMNKIQNSLGSNWEASMLGKHILLHNDQDPRGILLSI